MESNHGNATADRAPQDEPAPIVSTGDGHRDVCERCEANEFVFEYLDEDLPGDPALLCPDCVWDVYADCDECGRTALLTEMYGLKCGRCVECETAE